MKKLLALCLTVLLVVAMVPVFAVSADATPAITVSNAEGFNGDTVTVKVTLVDNPGIISAKIKVAYDAEVLELTASAAGSAYAGSNTTFSKTLSANPYVMNWSDGLAEENYTDTDFATFTFKIKDGAAVGDSAVELICDFEGDFFNKDMDAVVFDIKNGVVTVKCKHTETEETKAAVAPTCTEAGSTAEVSCKACGEVVTASTPVAATGHTEKVVNAKDATCTEAGYTGDKVCSVCDAEIAKGEEIAATGHTEKVVNAKDATCEDAGYTGDKVCSVCGITLEEGKAIDAKGHDIAEVAAKEATCDEDGNIAHFACSVCGETYADIDGAEAITDVIIKATGHKYADGKCSVCGEEEPKEEEKPADTDKPADKPNTDDGNKAPATNDVANIFVVASMLMAIAAAAVVVLKKKA